MNTREGVVVEMRSLLVPSPRFLASRKPPVLHEHLDSQAAKIGLVWRPYDDDWKDSEVEVVERLPNVQ
jgi:hypothetical protein